MIIYRRDAYLKTKKNSYENVFISLRATYYRISNQLYDITLHSHANINI